jgi:hypothetical protein
VRKRLCKAGVSFTWQLKKVVASDILGRNRNILMRKYAEMRLEVGDGLFQSPDNLLSSFFPPN